MNEQEEQMVALGMDAEALLQSEVFTNVVNALTEQSFQSFVNTDIADATKRERLYDHYRGIVDVVETLRHWVTVRDGILTNADNLQEEVDHE